MSTKKKLGWILLSSASLAAMGALSPALAQDDAVEDEIVVTATGRAAAIQDVPIAVTAVSGDQLENSGVQDLRDVTQLAPSLSMGSGQSTSSGTIARIRGIGTGSDNPGFEGAVGIFIDGVYRARAGAALADLPELERVEILRGPQGTLFGRNTSAGAISVVSAGPDYDPGMYLQTSYGFDDLEETGIEAGVNIPVSDSLAFRVDGVVRERLGYITDAISGDDINNSNRWSARGQAVWDISPDASLRLIIDGAAGDSVCCGTTNVSNGTTSALISALTGGTGVLPLNPEGRRMTVTPGRGYAETTDETGYSAQLDWDVGGMNFTSITAYRDWSAERDQDIDFTSADIAYRDGLAVGFKNFTQEFRLQGEAGALNWLVGAFYADEALDTTDTIRVGAQAPLYINLAVSSGHTAPEVFNFSAQPSIFQAVALTSFGAFPAVIAAVNATNGGYLIPSTSGQGQSADNWTIDTESLALFTHNQFNLSENLVLTLGLRYSEETKDLAANLSAANNTCTSLQAMEAATSAATPTPGGIVSAIQASPAGSVAMSLSCNPATNPIANGIWTGDHAEEEFSGTASLALHVSEDVMLYGGYSRGYKAGGFNVDRSGFSITPALTSSAALNVGQLEFQPEFTDAYELGMKSTIFGGSTTFNVTGFYQQIHDFQLNAFNGFNFITRNVPEAISQGVEIEMSARPTDGLTINGGLVYTDATFDSTVVFNTLDPVPNTVSTGDPLAQAPEWVATAAIAYEMPLGGDLRALFYVDGRYNSEYRVQTLNRQAVTDNQAFTVFNGRVGIGPENERWAVEIFGQNLTDEFYHVGGFAPPLQNSRVVFPNEPQTYGVSLRLQY